LIIYSEKETVSPGRICLEVTDKNDSLVQSVHVYSNKILFEGTHVFWQNTGWDNSWFPDAAKGTLRTPALRACDLDHPSEEGIVFFLDTTEAVR